MKLTNKQQYKKYYPENSLKIFISSNCEDEKFIKARMGLKQVFQKELNAEVFVYEDDHASSLPVETYYKLKLKISDICIVLVDNKEGVRTGVQKEIDFANKNNIKMFYLFSTEYSCEPTTLEISLKGHKERCFHVDCFEKFVEEGAKAVINDIHNIYQAYVKNVININLDEDNETKNVIFEQPKEDFSSLTIRKDVLEKIDKSTGFLHNYIFDSNFKEFFDNNENSSELDIWSLDYLKVLLDSNTTQKFKYEEFVEYLSKIQDQTLNNVVNLRWKAISEYFRGNIVACINNIKDAYELAKKNKFQNWLVNDLLIDMRNIELLSGSLKNVLFTKQPSREKLDNTNEKLHYPILDRINNDLQSYYVKQLYKEKTVSPNTVIIGTNHVGQCKMLVSYLLIAMYYGSLTYILLFYNKIYDFIFFLNCNNNSWNLRRELYRFSIFLREKDKIKGLERTFPEIFNYLNNDDALYIMKVSEKQPIHYYRRISEYLSFGSVGYYLADNEFNKYKSIIFSYIYKWLDDKECIINEGKYIFDCLNNVAHRINQNELIDFCCRFIDKKYTRWFDDLFDFMFSYIDLSIAVPDDAIKLLNKIEELLLNDDVKEIISYNNSFLSKFRRQAPKITDDLDKAISQVLPEYYDGIYKFETTRKKQKVYSEYVEKYIKIMKNNNQKQGKNGVYYDYGINYYETIRRIILDVDYKCNAKIQDEIINCVCETLKNTGENLSVRLNAVSLMLTILIKFKNSYDRNIKTINELLDNKDKYVKNDNTDIVSNINGTALIIGILLLEDFLKLGAFEEFIENMTYVNNESATILAVQNLFIKYLSCKNDLILSDNMNSSILQYTLQWLKEDNSTIKGRAVKLLMLLACNPKNVKIVNFEILNLIDNSNGYIKSYILQNMKQIENLPKETLKYIYAKCEKDQCYMVREIYRRIKK